MRYTLLLHYPEMNAEELGPEALAEGMREFDEYAKALDAAGVDTTLDVWAGAYHGFDQIKPKAPQSRELIDALIDHLRRHL